MYSYLLIILILFIWYLGYLFLKNLPKQILLYHIMQLIIFEMQTSYSQKIHKLMFVTNLTFKDLFCFLKLLF